MTPDEPQPPKMRCTDLTGQRFGRCTDLTGQRFGRWKVIERTTHPTRQGTFWRCVCDCGATKDHINSAALQRGQSKSCGCLRSDLIRKPADEVHHQRNPLYSIWMSMRTRCCNSNHPSYKNYGARGITIAPERLDNFDQFRRDMGPRPDDMTIERIDNNGPYCKQNCRWASRMEQSSNKRNNLFYQHRGEKMTLTQVARVEDVNFMCLRQRVIDKGMELSAAVAELQKEGSKFLERAGSLGGVGHWFNKSGQKRRKRKPNSLF